MTLTYLLLTAVGGLCAVAMTLPVAPRGEVGVTYEPAVSTARRNELAARR
jgi:hypothetical protein